MTESSFVAAKLISTAKTTSPVRPSAERRGEAEGPAKNMLSSASSSGKRPLQGTKLFVRIASSRSRRESMMRQPVTPAALQPKPIAIVRHCLPQAPQR